MDGIIKEGLCPKCYYHAVVDYGDEFEPQSVCYSACAISKEISEKFIRREKISVCAAFKAKTNCTTCFYNFGTVCANHTNEEPDTYGLKIEYTLSKYPKGCSGYRKEISFLSEQDENEE